MKKLAIKNEQETQKKVRSKKLSLLEHIEKIVDCCCEQGFTDKFFTDAQSHIRFVAKKMELTDIQSVFFSFFLNNSHDANISLSDMSREMKCKTVRAIKYMNDIDVLVERKLLIRCAREISVSYRVPMEVLNAVRRGENYIPKDLKNISIQELFVEMERLFNMRKADEIAYDMLYEELDMLLKNNRQLNFSAGVLGFGFDKIEQTLLLFFCYLFVIEADNCVGGHDFSDLYSKGYFHCIKHNLERGSLSLQDAKLVEFSNEDGFGDKEYYCLTDKAKTELLAELDITTKVKAKKDMLLSSSFVAKTLYYNPEEEWQIRRLVSLLQPDNFKSVQQRLTDSGMRTGFACLFYGAPGTGKTETVYQIARQTGRDIMLVDISATKSMWFGESEKKIKAIFDQYRAYVKTNELTPILLFNEADAVIGKRKDVTSSALSQTENAIQNIILQEIENLNGILIATTNLTQNLDNAFERRFLYKIEFRKPSLAAKQHIWQTMMPALSETDAFELANAYDFSGGQIENISRKRTVDGIITGEMPKLEALHEYCRAEKLNKEERKRIGFVMN
jgi:hypothetical protein